jgi:hypothetical protein
MFAIRLPFHSLSAKLCAAVFCFGISLLLISCGGGRQSDKNVSASNSAAQSNPVPTISSLSPAFGQAESAGFTLEVSGTDFVPDSLVRWNGTDRPTKYVNSELLNANISATDVATEGYVFIDIYNPAPGGGTSYKLQYVLVAAPIISSISPGSIVAGGNAFSLIVTGLHFYTTSAVYWNGSRRVTTLVGSQQLKAYLTAQDIAAEGVAHIQVINPAAQGGISKPVDFPIEVNPVPLITGSSSTSKVAGDFPFRLTVTGSNFAQDSVVRWNGSDRSTTYVSSSQLRANITEDDIASVGTAQVTVFNHPPGGGVSNVLTYWILPDRSNWKFLGAPNTSGKSFPEVHQIVVDSEDPKILYVSMEFGKGLFVSRDGGTSWTLAVPGEGQYYGVIAADPNNVNRVFFAQGYKLYVTNDRGLTFNFVHSFNFGVVSLKISKIYSDTIYAGLGGAGKGMPVDGFYRSQDGGKSWQSFTYGLSADMDYFLPWAIGEDPVDGTLYVGVELGNHPAPYKPPFLRSTDRGATWADVSGAGTEIPWHVIDIAIDPSDEKVFALTEGSGLYSSIDHGTTWTLTPNARGNCALLMDPNYTNRFFTGALNGDSPTGGAYMSTDRTGTFLKFGLKGNTICSLSTTGDSKSLFAAVYPSGIYVTPLPPPDEVEK